MKILTGLHYISDILGASRNDIEINNFIVPFFGAETTLKIDRCIVVFVSRAVRNKYSVTYPARYLDKFKVHTDTQCDMI